MLYLLKYSRLFKKDKIINNNYYWFDEVKNTFRNCCTAFLACSSVYVFIYIIFVYNTCDYNYIVVVER